MNILWYISLSTLICTLFIITIFVKFFKKSIVSCLLKYTKKPFFYYIFKIQKRVSLKTYLEIHIRTSTGKSLERPFGNPSHYQDWQKILFNPSFLSRDPHFLNNDQVTTTTLIGPQAQKPLKLKAPLLIAAMSSIALNSNTKMALAKTASNIGTATNSGNGPFSADERNQTNHYIFQYSRGFWSKNAALLKQTNLIEITLGQGAWASAPIRIKGKQITPELGKLMQTVPGLDVLIEATLPELNATFSLNKLVVILKEVTEGVPIGVKIGATHYLEQELHLIAEAGCDFVSIDGIEGGSQGAPPVIADNIGLPLFPALCRAQQFMKTNNLKTKLSLIVSGGLKTPGDYLKALALGADAVALGTITLIASVHQQIDKVAPWEPPTSLVFLNPAKKPIFDTQQGVTNLTNYFESCLAEMRQITGRLGKKSLQEVSNHDLVSLDPLYAQIANIDYYLK